MEPPALKPHEDSHDDNGSGGQFDVESFKTQLFHADPTAVVRRMIDDDEIDLPTATKKGVLSFLNNVPSFNMRQTSVLAHLSQPDAMRDVPESHTSEVTDTLKKLQRVQALAPVPDAVPVLFNDGIGSAFQVSQMPKAHFVTRFAAKLGESTAGQIHDHASAASLRIDKLLLQIFQTIKGTQLAVLDGQGNADSRMDAIRKLASQNDMQINLEALFGGLDFCDCPDCQSVTSPANYFVDLLQYLRNNNLDATVNPATKQPEFPNTGTAGIQGTALDALFQRRPDLQHLQLTCGNANTLIPYVDLVNEVMESFVVYLKKYPDASAPESSIKVFNVRDETSSELLAEPQHTNYAAYCWLRQAVYPLGLLPFFQPVAAIRIYLGFLQTSRTEIMDVFRKSYVTPVADPPFSMGEDAKLASLYEEIITRAISAEFLSIFPEEYVILTKEAFWPKAYFEVTSRRPAISYAEYQERIGVRSTAEYWGYDNDQELVSGDPATRIGLSWVKAQFLKRAGMQYTEVLDLVKTDFVNPFYPAGRDLVIFQSIHFSYRFLQTLVDKTTTFKRGRFERLIDFLVLAQPWADHLVGSTNIDQDSEDESAPPCFSKGRIAKFVYKWFDCLGKIVVLESGDKPTLPVWGLVVLDPQTPPGGDVDQGPPKLAAADSDPGTLQSQASSSLPGTIIGTLYPDGTITDNQVLPDNAITVGGVVPASGNVIAAVAIDSKAYTPSGQRFADQYKGQGTLYIYSKQSIHTQIVMRKEAVINDESQLRWFSHREALGSVLWNAIVDTCNIDTVRLLHLDGSQLRLDEWDGIQRFVRLWKRLGWTIDETDKALAGMGKHDASRGGTSGCTSGGDTGTDSKDHNAQVPDIDVSFNDFAPEDCDKDSGSRGGECDDCKKSRSDCTCDDSSNIQDPCATAKRGLITPRFLNLVVSIRKLQTATGLDLIKLLAFWADISTAGDNSLYSQLFLTHNITGVDPVFKPDAEGNYLITPTKISAHLPVILAVFRLKQAQLNDILTFIKLQDADLTLSNISAIYRYTLLAQSLGLAPNLLIAAIKLLGDPFNDASTTLTFVTAYNKMAAAGFTVPQLTFVISGEDIGTKPLAPPKTMILKTAKTLYDGLNAIDAAHPDVASDTAVTDTTITDNTSLMFDPSVVTQITLFLNGTTVYTIDAPAGLAITVPKALAAKVKYTDAVAGQQNGTLTITGILTGDETTQAKTLSGNSGWAKAVDRGAMKALTFFDTTISDIFPNGSEAKGVLLAGDVIVPANELDATKRARNTAPGKRAYFIKFFMPYLRDQLSNQLVSSTMAGVTGITSPEIVDALLTRVLTVSNTGDGSSQTALDVLRGLKTPPGGTASGHWTGYLIPQTTDKWVFVGHGDTRPDPLLFDRISVPFVRRQEDPDNVWFTDPIPLTGGRLYFLDAGGQAVPGLGWMTARTQPTVLPTTALLPDYSTGAARDVFIKFVKAGLVINGLDFQADEFNYLQAHPGDFGGFNVDSLVLSAVQRAVAYASFRDSLPKRDSTLVELFKWASTSASTSPPPSTVDVAGKIAAVTNWDADIVNTLLGANCLNLTNVSLFRNDVPLARLQTALAVAAKVAVPIPSLFMWADSLAKFWPTHAAAEDIRAALRARYSLSDWEQASKPLHDRLRMQQRDALVAFLTVQKPLVAWGVVDADSLFEYFLIDVQMGACLQTSRIKQAISSAQLFVQRCILGLEEDRTPSIPNDALDQVRWQWMSKQTVWTANRKVFLWPENYIVGSLRDDKTALYVTLENALKQTDAGRQAVQDAIKTYLFGLDQVANLLVEGLFADDFDVNKTVYIVAKTRSAPYLFFSRTCSTKGWMPWSPLPVDIPTYHVDAYSDSADAKFPSCDGSYVTPVVLDGRYLVFFGQLTLKSFPQNNDIDLTPGGKASAVQRFQTWEIKLGWSEYRNGKWAPKQLTIDSIMEPATKITAPPMDRYRFVPQVVSQSVVSGTSTVTVRYVSIGVYNKDDALVGGFEFRGSQAYALGTTAFTASAKAAGGLSGFSWTSATQFHFTLGSLDDGTLAAVPARIYSLQVTSSTFTPESRPYVEYPLDSMSTSKFNDPTDFRHSGPFYHEFSHQLLSISSASPNLADVYTNFYNQPDQQKAFGITGFETQQDGTVYTIYNELSAPYSLYNWEVGFHAPLQVADNLLQNSLFDQALDMCHLVFDPYADGKDLTRVWRWAPFANVNTMDQLEALLNGLQPNAADDTTGAQIDAWRNNPFAPHVVARDRQVAYMKWTVMKYLQILTAYGDYYFRQNSLEALPLAIQCYVLASHIYGAPGQRIPRRGKMKSQSYSSLQDKWNAFSNAVVDLELSFPFSNQSPHPVEFLGKDVVLANIFGFATTHYFCIPDNPQLTALGSLIDERLDKIRHCKDINGNTISRPLWDPPLDPNLLVSAVAQGLSLSSFLNDLNSPMPNYRFYYLLQKAIELCAELKSMAATFLSIKEKRDAEALQLLRQNQENVIQGLVMEVRKLQLDEANKSLEALRVTRNGPRSRYNYYTALAGVTAAALAETDSDYKEIALDIAPPTTVGGLVLTDNEKTEMDESKTAKDFGDGIGALEVLAGVCFAFPNIVEKAEPWGLGVSLSMGPANIGQSAQANARFLRILADDHVYTSTNAGRKATYVKQYQDRVQQANAAGFELVNINAQMATQVSRIASANQEVNNQQRVVENAAEVLDFLKNKYTNDDLYSFLEGSVKTLFYQTYILAYDVAKKAEAAYVFERGPQPSPFIQFGYWNVSRDGLQCGEQLYVALKKLEAAYTETRGWDFELLKPVSLRSLDPYAMVSLRETGSCQITLPEMFFDMDWPGHYSRRIKSVSLTLPCVTGPYTTVNATLRLLSHSFRADPTATDAKSYLPSTDAPDRRFQTSAVPVAAIAVSTGQNDSGAFELNLKDERYLPFEGAGAVSTWSLDLPALRQFDYDSISDVVLTLRYTARDGGDRLRGVVEGVVADYVRAVSADDGGGGEGGPGLYALIDMRTEFASEWARAVGPFAAPPAAGAGSDQPPRSIRMKELADRLPSYARGRDPAAVKAASVLLVSATDLPAGAYSLVVTAAPGAETDVSFDDKPLVGKLHVAGNTQPGVSFAGDWRLDISADAGVKLEKIWMIVRYILT